MKHKISEKVVEDIYGEISRIFDEESAMALSGEFVKRQPALSRFILTFTKDSSPDVSEMAFYLATIMWKCYEKISNGKLRKINFSSIIKEYHKVEELLQSLVDVDERIITKRVENNSDFKQPALMKFIADVLIEESEELGLTEEEEGYIFKLLTINMNCLDFALKRGRKK